jgi:hypothetical protein
MIFNRRYLASHAFVNTKVSVSVACKHERVQTKEDERDARDESHASILLAACVAFVQEKRVCAATKQSCCSLQMVAVVGQYVQHIVEGHRLVAKRRPETNRL